MKSSTRLVIVLIGFLSAVTLVLLLFRDVAKSPRVPKVIPFSSEHSTGTGTGLRLESKPDAWPWMLSWERAMFTNDIAEVKRLIQSGTNINENQKWGRKMTPLVMAITADSPELANFLLDHGANPNIADVDGSTPLMWAIIDGGDGNVDLVQTLVAKGADVNARDNHGGTPLMLARGLGSAVATNVVKILLEHGAKE